MKRHRKKFESLYLQLVNPLRRQDKVDTIIDVYSRQNPFVEHGKGRSQWPAVFYKHILAEEWEWVDIAKPPQTKPLPDALALKEIERVINEPANFATKRLFWWPLIWGFSLAKHENLRSVIPTQSV